MPPSSPFDFSDFGGRPPPPPPPPAEHDTPLAAPSGPYPTAGGFDPFAGQSPVAQPAAEEIFGGSAGSGPLTVGGPPLALLAAALAVAAAGVGLGAFAVATDAAALLAFAGWLLAGPVAIGVLAWFHGVDTRRRLSSVYTAPTWLGTAYWAVVLICAVGIGLGAWQIAWWAGRW